MKRLISLLMLLSLLLTACGSSPPPVTEPSTELPSDPTAANTGQSEASAAETPPTEMQEPPTSGVKTDFSHYYDSPVAAPKFTRLSDGPLTELRPNNNGLQLYPFAGKRKPVAEDAYSYLYGIVDETGCIMVDPIYEEVVPLINDTTDEILPIWVLRKAGDYFKGTIGFAAMDGSFAVDCIYAEVYANDGRLIAFYPQEPSDISIHNSPIRFDVYDLSGRLLFSSEELPFGAELIGPAYNYTYGEGLYTVFFRDPERAEFYSGIAYYMDEEGQILLGPYYSAEPFIGGIAEVSPIDSSTLYIDKTGSELPIPYGLRYTYPDGTYTVWEDTTPESVVYGQTTRTTWYAPSGEVLWVRDNCSDIGPHLAFYRSYDCGQAYVENLRTSQTFMLPDDTQCYGVGDPLEPIIVASYYDDQIHSYCSRYMTDDFRELGFEMSKYRFRNIYEIGSHSRTGVIIPEGGTATVYIGGDTPHATYPVGSFSHFEGYPGKIGAFTDAHYTRLFTSEGELFFSYPVGTMDD